ncbi:RarD protein, DMT superfamily transporter [Oleidesulfovibrio alaskensis G20]|jgi:chloramphenicol-sensitive protein RarD|uniref:RarD protein, DMT superfamily transporter n=1 Tax=Oleidesulfovibrio alaskensis (strain ATCC BAA-1058 / DSM 17464 / G20) TaxID=207559 RepID=Q312J5_OLEA2|nr:EamA family transporter RarD [Oleidesulfovibrio alaskensis]ABB38151.1 RarD protein, DMT superfamily transporter [Oleidesulfovibrio alaskensis G20]MBG0774064.1 EamA family transporter RarD [Oleidesulfovibrio alaskensis]MBL3583689.1 EamA family transporter RarD [Oleidesulfovibrio alaskensis]
MFDSGKNPVAGGLAAVGAFVLWGLLPLYWKMLHSVPPLEVLGHRIVWSLVFVAVLMQVTRRWDELRRAVSSVRNMAVMAVAGVLVGGNWFLYIWAVNNGRVLETSLGYYITPLLNVLMGCVLLGEQLSKGQKAALVLAAAGVAVQLTMLGRLPWVALVLAGSFSVYGLLRKTANVESVPGLFFETAVLTPVVLVYLVWLDGNGGAFGHAGTAVSLLLAGAGVCTSVPLLLFAFAARRMHLGTVGILQYIAPTIAFMLGVFVFDEPFSAGRLISFCFIWLAVAIYSGESLWKRRRRAVQQG